MGVLIDGGASHNFIDVAWVKRRDIQTESFDGFSVATASHTMECSQRIPQFTVKLGNHTVIDTFYVVDVPDMKVVWTSVDLFPREVFHKLPDHRDGVHKSRVTKASIERDEYLPSHASDITQDGGSTPTGGY